MGCEKPVQRPHRRFQGGGFSLLEVLMGIVVVVFALYGVLDLIASNQRLSLRAQRRATATELARAKMAEIQVAGFDAVTAMWPSLPGGPPQSLIYPPDPAEFKTPYKADPFRWQLRLDRDPQYPEAINVEVRVLWYATSTGLREQILENSVSVGGLLVKK
jgi:type II secretory pathway pseudopilin PulG